MPKDYLHIYLSWSDPTTGRFYTYRSPLENENGPVSVTLGRGDNNSIKLSSNAVSVSHVQIEYRDSNVFLKDLDSINGTWVDGHRQKQTILKPGMSFQVGPFIFQFSLKIEALTVENLPASALEKGFSAEQVDDARAFDRSALDWLVSETLEKIRDEKEQVDDSVKAVLEEYLISALDTQKLTHDDLAELNLPIQETTYLSLGGGLGSFVWVDRLLISGVDIQDVTVIGVSPEPYRQFQRLCEVSQIPDHERLRCDSRETLDNLWGWPGYATREFTKHIVEGDIKDASQVLWRCLAAPFFSGDYMPRTVDFIESIAREAARIGWNRIWKFGVVQAIRLMNDGRYAIFYSTTGQADQSALQVMIATYLHLAFGFPGIRFETDLQAYRLQTGDFRKVVNAYEEHEHVYQELSKNGGDVLLRGEGIFASRILQRLATERENNPDIGIVHVRKMPVVRGASYGSNSRKIENYWELQSLSWPKAAYSGNLHVIYQEASDEERELLSNDWGGMTTIDRKDWLVMTANGLSEGWYQTRFGQIERVIPSETGQIITEIRGNSTVDEKTRITTDFVIDATGLNVGIDKHEVIGDLLKTYQIKQNAKGYLCVSDDFEIVEMRNESGRVFVSGVMASGGSYVPVATFAGLQYAAQQSVKLLQKQRAPGAKKIAGMRSLIQWIRWALRKKP